MDFTPLNLLIVAKDPLARAGLDALLNQTGSLKVVSRLSPDEDLLAALDIYQPNIILWDAGWDISGDDLEQFNTLSELVIPVVVLVSDNTYAAEIWASGAKGLLLRDAPPEQLVAALEAASQGLVIIEPTLTAPIMPFPPLPQLTEPLTPRESEVLQLLAQGLPNKTIAQQLKISEHTVKFHVNAIMTKLAAQSRTQAVVRATQLGLILL